MSQQLPPLNALRAFEAVARHGSFTKAAEELFVTRAAISHQVKYLENFLGFTLIERHNRSIALTQPAEIALSRLRDGFNQIADAVHLMRIQSLSESISVWTTPSFASKWLVPRLPRFAEHYPDIDMRISGDVSLVEQVNASRQRLDQLFHSREIDVMIGFGLGNYPSCRVEKLFNVQAVPLCHPDLLQDARHPLREPSDLAFHTLLHDETPYEGRPNWEQWLQVQQVKGVNHRRGVRFNHMSLAFDAVLDKQGVLLGIHSLARLDIEAGRLCIPFHLPLMLDQAYYVIRPAINDSNSNAVDAFVAWLHAEAQQVETI